MDVTDSVIRRFWERVDTSPGHGPSGECHVWTGSTSGNGYGQLGIKKQKAAAHRLAWYIEHGAFPDRPWQILHLPVICNNPICVNTAHLRLGTQAENMRDCIIDGTDRHAIRTHCPAGHEYDEANTYYWIHKSNGRPARSCRACRAESSRQSKLRRRKSGEA